MNWCRSKATVPDGAYSDDLGERLRAERTRRGIGLRQAADEIGVSFNTLSRIERGADCRYSHARAVLRWLTSESTMPLQAEWGLTPRRVQRRTRAAETERDRYREALEDIADERPDGKAADFHFWGRSEDREKSMMKRASEALTPSEAGDD